MGRRQGGVGVNVRHGLVLAVALAAAACVPVGDGPRPPKDPLPPDIMPVDDCGALALQGWIGRPLAELAPQLPPERVRVIRPGDAVTMDFSPQRLNVLVDDRAIVTELRCG